MKIRKEIHLDTEAKIEGLAALILSKCPPRKISQLIAISLVDLAENYNLASATQDDISNFIKFYDYIKCERTQMSSFRFFNPGIYDASNNVNAPSPNETVVSKKEVPHTLTSDADKEKMKAIALMMGGI